jgi:hypothetical protein
MSLRAVARAIGRSPSWLSSLLRDPERWTPENIESVSAGLGVGPGDYFREFRELRELKLDPFTDEFRLMPVGRIKQLTQALSAEDRFAALWGATRGALPSGTKSAAAVATEVGGGQHVRASDSRASDAPDGPDTSRVNRDEVERRVAAVESMKLAHARALEELAALGCEQDRDELPEDVAFILDQAECCRQLIRGFPRLRPLGRSSRGTTDAQPTSLDETPQSRKQGK